MKQINKFNELIDFTLNKYGLSATYKVKCLDKVEYKNFYSFHRFHIFLSRALITEILEFFSDFIEDYGYLEEYEENVKELNKSEEGEYGSIAPLKALISDNLKEASVACNVSVTKSDPLIYLSPFLPQDSMKDQIGIFSKVCRGKDQYSIILLRKDLFCSVDQKKNKRSECIAHESIHIVEKFKKRTYHKFEIDHMAMETVMEYNKDVRHKDVIN